MSKETIPTSRHHYMNYETIQETSICLSPKGLYKDRSEKYVIMTYNTLQLLLASLVHISFFVKWTEL